MHILKRELLLVYSNIYFVLASNFIKFSHFLDITMVYIGKAFFTLKFFIASILIFISGLLHLAAFAGPYWSQSYPSTGNEFKNIGLWDVCFYRYRHWKDDNQKPYTGCFWFWSPDMIRFRDWIMPRKWRLKIILIIL